MVIKKFQGKTEEDALEMARRELGDALVIMNVKSVKPKGLFSIFRSQIKEVTVALEEDAQGQSSEQQKDSAVSKQEADLKSTVAAVSEIARKHFDAQKEVQDSLYTDNVSRQVSGYTGYVAEKEIEKKLSDLQSFLEKNMRGVQEGQPQEEEQENMQEQTDSNVSFFKILYSIMMENEVDEKIANQLIDEIDRSMKPNMPIDYMLSNVYQKLILKFGQPAVITPAQKGPKFIFFIGPTGVGKTTTIAKIASKFRVEDKKKIAMLTADTFRIAAAEQLRTYAAILEVPFRVIYTPSEIEAALHDFQDYDYVLIDTAGYNHYNQQQRANINELLEALDSQVEREIYLVVSATTKYSDLLSIADVYQTIKDYKLIFTKLDETATLGILLNLRLYTGAQMSYVTCGQNVPDDIAEFDAQETVKKLLRGKQF